MREYANDGNKYLLPVKIKLFTPIVILEKLFVFAMLGGFIAVLALFVIRQGFNNITNKDILVCVGVFLIFAIIFIIGSHSAHILVDDEKLQHKSIGGTKTIYWSEIDELQISIQDIYSGMTRGIKHSQGKSIELEFYKMNNKQSKYFISCFKGTNINPDMLKNSILYTYGKYKGVDL
ncbi:MAG: hypothetical protein J6Q50_03015 [Clostridia bacterium]|nr:hypothetical protein [Clostridia bacterium]